MKKIFFYIESTIFLTSISFSQNWFIQNVSLTNSNLHSVDFVDENIGWAVGKDNTIFKTIDGGDTWINQSTNSNRIYSVDFIDENIGYVVGSANIRRTTDGGNTWIIQSIGTGQALYSVFFVNKDTGWAVGYPGKILKTTDGGINWISQMDTISEPLYSVYFLNDTIGFIAGSNLILKTTNSGQDWMVKSDNHSNSLRSIYFTDENTGYAVGSTYVPGWNHCILKSTDGGNSWSYVSIGTNLGWLNAVFFVNQDTGWVAGTGTDFRKTTDGGLSWIDQSLGLYGSDETLNSIDFVNNNIGWVVGGNGIIFKTTDSGNSWLCKSNLVTTADLNSVFFTDIQFGWIAGEDGTILHTTNSGSNWVKQSGPSTSDINSIYFIDKNLGWCAGVGLLKTTDGGSSWSSHHTYANLNSVYFVDSNNGWAVGKAGMLLKTTNGGENWFIKSSGTSEDLCSIYFIDSDIGWILGRNSFYVPGYGWFYDRRIMKSYNGGESWYYIYTHSYFGNNISVGDIYFIDQNTGWVCNPNYPLIKTTDGGNSWVEMNYEGGRTIQFINSDIGWIAGNEEGEIKKSTDGGLNWINQSTGVTVRLNSIFFLDESTGWAVGANGTILSTLFGSSVEDFENPNEFLLSQNYPNPFNPATTITYQIPQREFVTLKVYDILGREVATLVNEEKPAGSYEVEFNSHSVEGRNLTSGIYFYQLNAGGYSETKKMILLK
jgi:photosystem II stability/assembly factor-like uncharacterized protein